MVLTNIGIKLGGTPSSSKDVELVEKFRLSITISAFISKAFDSISIKVVLISIPNDGERTDALNQIFAYTGYDSENILYLNNGTSDCPVDTSILLI